MRDFIVDWDHAERKIADMRACIDVMLKTYNRLCESAKMEAGGWQADSRETFETKMSMFAERCQDLKKRADRLFDAQCEYFRRLKIHDAAYNG